MDWKELFSWITFSFRIVFYLPFPSFIPSLPPPSHILPPSLHPSLSFLLKHVYIDTWPCVKSCPCFMRIALSRSISRIRGLFSSPVSHSLGAGFSADLALERHSGASMQPSQGELGLSLSFVVFPWAPSLGSPQFLQSGDTLEFQMSPQFNLGFANVLESHLGCFPTLSRFPERRWENGQSLLGPGLTFGKVPSVFSLLSEGSIFPHHVGHVCPSC